ncbi:universal stress protein [Pseudonocardia artemisiae]
MTEGTWPACIDAVRAWAPEDAEIVLLHVHGSEIAAAHGAFAGLLGRGRRSRDPERSFDALVESSAAELLDRAAERLGRPTALVHHSGRLEREVVKAADGADLLICARDGDRSRLGPRSLGPDTRFVVDHAPCPVLLVWPESAPDVGSIPPPPPPGHRPLRHPTERDREKGPRLATSSRRAQGQPRPADGAGMSPRHGITTNGSEAENRPSRTMDGPGGWVHGSAAGQSRYCSPL